MTMNGTTILHLCHIFNNCLPLSPEQRVGELLNSGSSVLHMSMMLMTGWKLLEQYYSQSTIRNIWLKLTNSVIEWSNAITFPLDHSEVILTFGKLRRNLENISPEKTENTGKEVNHEWKSIGHCQKNKHERKNSTSSEGDEMKDALDGLRGDQWKPTGTHLWVYTVARYPDNHNPLLPLSLQQQLDEMSPRDFLTYVLKDLTLEERESLMVDEKQRRKTFLVNWPRNNNLSGVKMAQAGFYSLDDYDRVQCVFCRGSLHGWEADDNPMTEHARSFNFCRFVKGLDCGNREHKSDALSEEELRNVTRFRALAERNDEMVDGGSLGISTNRAAMIRYAPDATRLKTFSRWPPSAPISGQRMCDAGFYFTGFDDQVRCFYCSGGIREWSANDDPWEEHARWFPDCAFLVQQRGQYYVEQVHARTPNDKKCVRQTKSQKKAEVKEVKVKTEQEDMRMFCDKLGHSADAINNVIAINGRPFDNIKMMIDALYALEENENSADILKSIGERPSTHNNSAEQSLHHNQNASCPEEDKQRLLDQDVPNATHGTFNGSERRQKYKTGCRNCEMRTDSFVPATHVGLPCGHLIYCDSCNADEKRKTSDLNYSPKCLFHDCGGPLTGSIKIYFA